MDKGIIFGRKKKKDSKIDCQEDIYWKTVILFIYRIHIMINVSGLFVVKLFFRQMVPFIFNDLIKILIQILIDKTGTQIPRLLQKEKKHYYYCNS